MAACACCVCVRDGERERVSERREKRERVGDEKGG